MTWQVDKSRWVKMERGVWYRVSIRQLRDCFRQPSIPATKEGSYQWANRWWEEFRQANIPTPTYGFSVEGVDDVTIALSNREANGLLYQEIRERGLNVPDALTESIIGKPRLVQLREGVESLLHASKIPEDATLGFQVDQFLVRQSAKVQSKEMTAGRYDNVRRSITLFLDFLGSHKLVTSIVEHDIDMFHDYCSAKMIAKMNGRNDGWSPDYAKSVVQVMKTFIKYCWVRKMLELPRNLDVNHIKVRPKTIKPMPIDDFRKMIDKASGQLKLHLLLMANCGMRSTDISDLTVDEVDWEHGRIKRQRSKTRIHNSKDVPIVDYKLWEQTFALLKHYRSEGNVLNGKGEPIVLLTKSNGLWAWEEIIDGKLKCSDNIATNFNRLKSSLKLTYPLSSIRKAGASILNGHDHYGRYASHYLGESPRGITDKNYAAPSNELFDTILAWLGEQFGASGS